MSSWRKCVFGCNGKSKLFVRPTEEARRDKCISGNTDKKVPKNIFVCEQHFTEDAFRTTGILKLDLQRSRSDTLEKDAVPTIPGSSDDDPRSVSLLRVNR
ncbi:hypothetical protein NL108_014363 [Boleophthalmus pectinirostris]|nr:hypothetical protein NL108_014363 [Boleophthalmus pectinirostris]